MSSIDVGHDADDRDFAYQKLSDVEEVPPALPLCDPVTGLPLSDKVTGTVDMNQTY